MKIPCKLLCLGENGRLIAFEHEVYVIVHFDKNRQRGPVCVDSIDNAAFLKNETKKVLLIDDHGSVYVIKRDGENCEPRIVA